MRKYKRVDISERDLEDLIRQAPELIEDGLRYIDHQRPTDRGPLDVLMVDSGGALVVAELKVVEEPDILWQGIDYYDWVTRNLEGLARAYSQHGVSPTETPRLMLVAPSFSVSVLNRCRWIDIPISLFAYSCLQFDDDSSPTPVFSDVEIPSTPSPATESHTVEQQLGYVQDTAARERMAKLLEKMRAWAPSSVHVDPIKYNLSVKVNGRVFCYLCPRRQFFHVETFNEEWEWTAYPIRKDEDIEEAMRAVRATFDKRKTGSA